MRNIELLKQSVQQILGNILNSAILLVMVFLRLNSFALNSPADSITTTSIEGYVCDSLTEIPLQYAEILIGNTQYRAVADSSGYFIISDIPIANYNLTVRFIGYHDHHKRLKLQQNKNFIKICLISSIEDGECHDNIIELRTLPLGYSRDKKE